MIAKGFTMGGARFPITNHTNRLTAGKSRPPFYRGFAFLVSPGSPQFPGAAEQIRILPFVLNKRQSLRHSPMASYPSFLQLGLALPAFLLAVAVSATPPSEVVSAANTDFAVSLYHQLAHEPGNLFFSPYSISSALAMALEGARGETATQMAAALHLTLPREQLADGFARLDEALKEAAGDHDELVAANSVWTQPEFPFRPAYLTLLQSRFGAEARSADFMHDAAGARAAINRWVGARTRGRIPELVGPGSVGPATRMVLCNAVYFKGRWERKFNQAETKPAPFYLAPGAAVSVPMMHQTAPFRWVAQDDFDLLELPYAGRLSMVILLPHARDGLPGVERQLTADHLRLWLATLDFSPRRDVQVYLPHFIALESYRLRSVLSSLGLRAAFDPAAADFSGMTADPGLCLSDVVHKAYVKVDEEGTEATAATGAIVMLASAMPRPVEFRVDHPFLFLIRDDLTNTILFLGRIADPL